MPYTVTKSVVASCAFALAVSFSLAAAAADRPHNVVLFIPDGLRALKVTPHTAPAMAAIRDRGVNFVNSHSLFPTFTTANASAMATGHYLGDTGDFKSPLPAQSIGKIGRLIFRNGSERRLLVHGPGVSTQSIRVAMGSYTRR